MRGYFAHVFKILPVNGAPGNAGVMFNHLNIAHFGFNFRASINFLVITGSGFYFFRFYLLPAKVNINESIRCKQVGTT